MREAVSLTAEEALKIHVVDYIAQDVRGLLDRRTGIARRGDGSEVTLDTAGAELIAFDPDWRTRLLSVIASPSLALVLMMLGIYGLLFEFSNPGFVLPGVVGGICLLLALFAFQMLPISYTGLGLIVLGMAFLVAEVFVPTSGALGVGGVLAFAIGAIILVDTDAMGFGIPMPLIATLVGISVAVRIRGRANGGAGARRPVVSGQQTLLDGPGEVLEDFTGEGWASVRGEIWQVRSARPLAPGQQVRVTGIDGAHAGCGAAVDRTEREHVMIWSFGWVGVVVLLAILVASAMRILREYERGVVFTLGRFWKVKGPGLVILIPGIQQLVKVDLRTVVLEVPTQDVISRDNVSVKVSAVVYLRVIDAEKAIIQVENYLNATSQLAQTMLRSVLGKHQLDDMLAEREKLNLDIQQALDAQTDSWGIKVSNVEIKQVDLTESMIRAIARQAEAERERRAKVIHAEGELQASEKLFQAAKILAQEPQAIQLRYLETLTVIGADKNTTIVFPLPMDVLTPFLQRKG